MADLDFHGVNKILKAKLVRCLQSLYLFKNDYKPNTIP